MPSKQNVLNPIFFKDLRAEMIETTKKLRNVHPVWSNKGMAGIVEMGKIGDASKLLICLPTGETVGQISVPALKRGNNESKKKN